MMKKRFALALSLVATTVTAQAFAASGAADYDYDHIEDCPKKGWSCEYTTADHTQTNPWDDGGTDASVTIVVRNSYGDIKGSYQAKFHAYNETLELSDHFADGARIHGYVNYVIDGKSTFERFTVGGGTKEFEIGPGNDLPEGKRVSIGFYVPGNPDMISPPDAVATT